MHARHRYIRRDGIFTAWFVPWYHQRDPAAVIRYVPRIAASAAFLGIIVLLVRLLRAYLPQ